MGILEILRLVLGLSIFLFGMNIMGDSLKESAGDGLGRFLERVTSRPLRGFFLGALVTALIQSSSATTVMVVGFVNSGKMMLSWAVSVIMGANVGTAVTSWITALSGIDNAGGIGNVLNIFKPSFFTPIVALVGILFYSRKGSRRRKILGTILLGFSTLMLGMDIMSDSVGGLRDNEAFRSILLTFENPLLGLLTGMVMTAVVQSSSASIGILQSFTSTGAITFGNAVPIIMGQNIGTCITAILASTGTSKNAKRASLVHLLFNVLGAVIGLTIFCLLRYVYKLPLFNGSIDMWGIAAVHTIFNLLAFVVLFPIRRVLERIAVTLVADKRE